MGISMVFLVPRPQTLQLAPPSTASSPSRVAAETSSADVEGGQELLAEKEEKGDQESEEETVPLTTVLRIPNLVLYCIATMFAKMVFYAFLFWLPFYLKSELGFSDSSAGYLSILFDLGGFVGGIVGGWASDRYKSRGLVCCILQFASGPLMIAYQSGA